MTRGLTTDALTAVRANAAFGTIAVQLNFVSGMFRACDLPPPRSLLIDGDEFFGIGAVGSVSKISESGELASNGITLQLSGIPRDMVSVALGEEYQNRPATIWHVPLDDQWRQLGDPIVIFRGRMDTMPITIGETATIGMTVKSRLADWERLNGRRFSDWDQKQRYPTDRGFEYAAAMESRQVVWPARAWFERHPG